MIGHRKSYSSRGFLVFPKHGITPLSLQAWKFRWRSETACCQSQKDWKGEWKKADLCYLWLYRSGYHPFTQFNMKLSVVCQPSEALDGLLQLQNALSLVSVCVHGAWGTPQATHVAHSSPCALCCFCMMCSFRSFLVPNPFLHTSCSGNSKALHLFPQDRGSSQLLSFFFRPHRHFGKLPLSSPVPKSLIFCRKPRALNTHVFLPHLFLLSGVWIIQSMWQEGQSCGGGIVMLGDAAVSGFQWKDNCRLDWWLLDAQTWYQGFT